MEDLLTRTPSHGTESFLVEVRQPDKRDRSRSPPHATKLHTPQQALEILKSEPDFDSLISTLKYLKDGEPSFSITSPGPLAAQLVHVLVSETVPAYWNVLQSLNGNKTFKQGEGRRSSNLYLLLSCLRSVSGLNAILLSLKQMIQQSKETKKSIGGPNIQEVLKILLEVLSELLRGNSFVEGVANDIWNNPSDSSKQRALWNEFLITIGGKALGIAAEAEDILNNFSKEVGDKNWTSDGGLYSKWIACNISHWARSLALNDVKWKYCAEVLSKAFRLGHTDIIIKELLTSLIHQRKDHSKAIVNLLNCLPNFEQRNFVLGSLGFLSGQCLSATIISDDDSKWWLSDKEIVSAAAQLISLLLAEKESRKTFLSVWLTGSSGAGIGDGIAIRRAAVAALAGDKTDIETILERSLQQFGDRLYIRHTPIMQQEVHTQVLLLSAGYLHRTAPLRLAKVMRSGAYLAAVSNRLAASSPRARFLGMIVGEALSGLVDQGDKGMDFKLEDTKTSEAIWYKSLVMVSDTIGPLDYLKLGSAMSISKKRQISSSKPSSKPKVVERNSRIVAIEEINEDSEEEEFDDDGLVPYEKPDSDVEDSDEDATLITRNKLTAPVYIRDLITYLRDTDNYDKQKLALQTAPSLIRRKANFGTEVISHVEELATLLVGLQDKYDIDKFPEMRLQGMIAVLIAEPFKMGQWFSKTFFDGDYSLSQRASVLTTLGLGARELGGLDSDEASSSSKPFPISSFPSKTLPEKMHKLYASNADSSSVDRLSTQLSNIMIAPMAAELADKLTGPSVLKVRTFSSRMAVEKKRKKPMANALAKVVADGFFFPLTGRFFIHIRAFGTSRSSSSSPNVIFQPYLLALFIKTLSLLLHASGPSTLSLPQMTSEFWDLLLGLRTQSLGDIAVTEALLFAFLTILEVNEDKRMLVETHGRQLLETQEWVEGIFKRVGAGGSEEDEKVRMLAAGCLVRIREVVEKYQALLMGDLAIF